MDWRPLALSVPLLFVIFQALSKTLPKTVSIFLVNAYASLAGLAIMLILYFATSHKGSAPHGKYIGISVLIGLLIGLGNFGIIKAYSLGAPQSTFTAMFYVALIIYGVLFGILVWHEHLKAIQLLGIILAAIGIFIAAYFRNK
jgi:drug/metabolite transporter (DMT)-like permease